MRNPTTAKSLVLKHGKKLIGRWIVTQRYGEWPGGMARVFALSLDPAAPEIVFNVSQGGTTIGVFDHEVVFLSSAILPPSLKQTIAEDLALVSGYLPNTGPVRDCFTRLAQRITEFEELNKP